MQKITIELTEDQIDKIVESRQPKKNLTYSIIGASKQLGISQSTIHRLIKSGDISTQIIGKSPRISQVEIEKYLNKV